MRRLSVISYQLSDRQNSKKGFTLIELLVAISIISLLVGFGMTTYMAAQRSGRDVRRKQDLNVIRIALEAYYQANKIYPGTTIVAGGGVPTWYYSSAGTNWIAPASGISPLVSGSYLSRIPLDPLSNTANSTNPPWTSGYYGYAYATSDGAHFDLVAQMENNNDSDRCGTNGWKNLVTVLPWCRGDSNQYPTGPVGAGYNNIYEASPDR